MQATDSAAMVVEKPRKKHELLHSLRKYRGLLPADYKFDREEANARGKWDDPE
jgi:antitoxin MazE